MDVQVRPMRAGDVAAADRVFRLAFGTFFGLPDPTQFAGDAALIGPRFALDPEAAFVAEADGRLVGSAMVMHWGSLGILGPISVDPAAWGHGIARQLMPSVIDLFDRRKVRLGGLYTHPHSPLHIRLYEAFGFALRHLVGVMARPVPAGPAAAALPGACMLLSALGPSERETVLAGCRAVSDALFAGLDLGGEIVTVADRRLGDTLLLGEPGRVEGFAVCHSGAGSEGGSAAVYVKFGAVLPGIGAAERMTRLLEGCEALARARGVGAVRAGVNSARRETYALMKARGYRVERTGVAMHRPDLPGYDRPGCFALDDWR